ncbi:MAG: UvrD-helicase domain-containing protein [Halobacteriota archaeon]
MSKESFDVLTVDLKKSSLLEASAGTGKTYSLAILVLKLILQKKVPVEKILMVTFTRAATADLEARIRKFIREAYKVAKGGQTKIDKIGKLIGDISDEKKTLLQKAVQNLDRISVMTIHGFCQAQIEAFTFETNQPFDFEVVTDDTMLLQKAAGKYFREYINTLDEERYDALMNKELIFKDLTEMLRAYLNGKKFYDLDTEAELSELEELEEERRKELVKTIEENFEEIQAVEISNRSDLGKNRNSTEEFIPQFIKYCCEKQEKKYIKAFDFIYYPHGKRYSDALESRNLLYLDFFKKASKYLKEAKKRNGLIAYNDQIRTIHTALQKKAFRKKLAQKYDAVFIDEFQDTDKYQYEIFSEVFGENSIVFYIGDPKQSIYGWRSADLDTYKKARELTGDDPYRMNVNYRSTPAMIEALNSLLSKSGDFNMFLDDKIFYEEVTSGAKSLGALTYGEDGNSGASELCPVTIWDFDINDENKNIISVANEIYALLTDENYEINGRRVEPKDIGVLVRTNNQGRLIKKELSRLNIPSLQIDSGMVTKSEEVSILKNLLLAVIEPRRGDIYRVLNQVGIGITTERLKTMDDKKHIENFLELREILENEGIYAMISSFLTKYDVRSESLKNKEGQRMLMNIIHLTELLHREERKNKLSPEELLVWLDRGELRDEEEYEQRIESDEDAVRISTVHKAKGLEYNIVFAPFLCLVPIKSHQNKGRINHFKKEGEYYFTLNVKDVHPDDKKLFDEQKEQENRRVVYVALTRAVYKTYISLVPTDKTSSFGDIYNHFSGHPGVEVVERSIRDIRATEVPSESEKNERTFRALPKPDIEIKNTFSIQSFSALSSAHHISPFEVADLSKEDAYNHFIFQELRRGANVGTALHGIFEYLEFDKPGTWEQTIMNAEKYFSNVIKEEHRNSFLKMVRHTMHSHIIVNKEEVQLCKVGNDQMIPEMEFYFSVDKINRAVLNEYLGEDATVGGESDIRGLMTGFIDLVFEQNGKYYILDWKSNYLGNSVDDYDQDDLEKAMTGSNYHLQYMIYTVALKRWLETKIPGFDYEKHFGGVIYVFLRGVRENLQTGIFTSVPDKEEIDMLDQALSESFSRKRDE